jgi:transposase
VAWWRGDGALARTCLDRALDATPGYRLALLLERMLDLGVRPGDHGGELAVETEAG